MNEAQAYKSLTHGIAGIRVSCDHLAAAFMSHAGDHEVRGSDLHIAPTCFAFLLAGGLRFLTLGCFYFTQQPTAASDSIRSVSCSKILQSRDVDARCTMKSARILDAGLLH
jgi:hypothetical protein